MGKGLVALLLVIGGIAVIWGIWIEGLSSEQFWQDINTFLHLPAGSSAKPPNIFPQQGQA